jgi:prepilin-type N-terminal cleavage/methylation domain-containing protein
MRDLGERSGAHAARFHRSHGFTLIELMVVISIIGVLSAVALPGYQAYIWRTKRNEAYLNLNGIYKSQKAHYNEFNRYGSTFEEIGFEIGGGVLLDPTTLQSKYYTYTLEAFSVNGVANANYSAVATGDLDPSDAMLDIVMIEGGVVIVE